MKFFIYIQRGFYQWVGSSGIGILIFFLCLKPVFAESIQFKPAYHKDFDKPVMTEEGLPAIQFDSFEPLDWKALAQKHFKNYPLDIEQISRDQLGVLARDSYFGYASISFTAPAPISIIRQKMIFLTGDGSQEVVARELKGVVRYKFDRDGKKIVSVDFFGYVLAAPKPNNIQSGGFVGKLSIDQNLEQERRVILDAHKLALINPYRNLGIKRQIQYEFQGSSESYLVLEYVSDTDCNYGCCEHRYVLFEIQRGGKHYRQISGCAYDCDV